MYTFIVLFKKDNCVYKYNHMKVKTDCDNVLTTIRFIIGAVFFACRLLTKMPLTAK